MSSNNFLQQPVPVTKSVPININGEFNLYSTIETEILKEDLKSVAVEEPSDDINNQEENLTWPCTNRSERSDFSATCFEGDHQCGYDTKDTS